MGGRGSSVGPIGGGGMARDNKTMQSFAAVATPDNGFEKIAKKDYEDYGLAESELYKKADVKTAYAAEDGANIIQLKDGRFVVEDGRGSSFMTEQELIKIYGKK